MNPQGVFRQVHTGFRDVQYFRGPSFECHPSATARPLVQLDGENVGRAPVRFGLEPGALRVVVP